MKKILYAIAGLLDHSISLFGLLLICNSKKEAVGWWLIIVGIIYLSANEGTNLMIFYKQISKKDQK